MNIVSKIAATVFMVMMLVAGAGCIKGYDTSSLEYEISSLEYEISWLGTPPTESKAIEMKIAQEVSPYSGTNYSNVTLSASVDNDSIRIHAVAISSSFRYPDLYDFTYRDGELILLGYLLEAIPEPVRNEAIGIAVQNYEISAAFEAGANAYGTPSVKRILPETAEKFYTPKTLLSVTWMDSSVSALVDMDNRQVVEVWIGN
ncbi:MAG: hypothetical protein JXA38_06230 [Methanosarcinaceae archaeon]|nr:hypothetical protein [Methanosarcinaceae archaeon]